MAHDFEAVPAFDPASGFEPGDASLVERCQGPTLDVGAGPGRLTVALTERGIPALGIDVTPNAVRQTRSAGALALMRDVFGHIPGAGRWRTVLLADGAIGIGGDPAALLRRIGDLLAPQGRALVELQPPGDDGPAAADQIDELARTAGMELRELWTESGRWFAELDGSRVPASTEDDLMTTEPVTTEPVTRGPDRCAAGGPGWPAIPEPG
ncbi:MAG TPA: methyltransferase domain-containing protein [Streptosporangiaceae bacterium]|jgi:SAM-dependent methyltransferase|nr:methyltransferase domain-containing protein [Streptosporangiaceae bacterium]